MYLAPLHLLRKTSCCLRNVVVVLEPALQSWRAPLVALHEDRHQFGDEKALWVQAWPLGWCLPDPGNPDVSQHVVRDLIVEITWYANYDGPSLSIGPSDNSLARMNVRNGSDGLHLDPQNFEFSRFSGFRLHTQTTWRPQIRTPCGWADLRKSD